MAFRVKPAHNPPPPERPRRCFRCGAPATRLTRINGPEQAYCPEHVPERLVAFRRAAFGAMLRRGA